MQQYRSEISDETGQHITADDTDYNSFFNFFDTTLKDMAVHLVSKRHSRLSSVREELWD